MHSYKGVYMPLKMLYVSIFIFITSFSKIKCKLCENKSMYGKIRFCICSYKEVKSSHSHNLPNPGMPWSILPTLYQDMLPLFLLKIAFYNQIM